MAIIYFQVRLSVQAKSGGNAELVPPKTLEGSKFRYIIVNDGGEEGIIALDESKEILKKVEKDKDCKKLAPEEMEALKKGYPAPKLKKQYRIRPLTGEAGETAGAQFEVDEQGQMIVDTIQTVRSGFYLIDVPILT